MESKIPDFVLVCKGVTYIIIGEDFAPVAEKEDPIIRRPRRLE